MLNKGLTCGKSFILIKNNRGPRIEPCGTPVSTTLVDDIEPLKSTYTDICLICSYEADYWQHHGYHTSLVCLAIWSDQVSNALDKSIYMFVGTFPISICLVKSLTKCKASSSVECHVRKLYCSIENNLLSFIYV